ncbi:hypothetical protein C0585_01255 [Candidatus Woesearchaeota archaeon]|nr:MAG: hypothetical protein C0585_01255 [Candidatus Woesearchaeota archaeon]
MILTIDIEFLDQTSKEIKKLLSLLKKHNAKATFFIQTNQISKHKDLIKLISKNHEIGSHTENHHNLQKIDKKILQNELVSSKEKIKRLGIKCKGFRAPYNLLPKSFFQISKKIYEYDSSQTSFYFPFRYNYRKYPNKPYKLSEKMYEFPISNFTVFKFPALLSFLKLTYPLIILPRLDKKVFSMHDYDLKKGIFDKNASFFVRFMQKINSGKIAFYILEKLIEKQEKVISCEEFLSDLRDKEQQIQ